ncbi:MAG: putative glycoside hydrolase [bacterium]
MKKHNINPYLSILIVAFAACFCAVIIYSQVISSSADFEWLGSESQIVSLALNKKIIQSRKPDPIKVKGLYLTAYSAGNNAKMNEIISLIQATELNSVVIDIKDYSGYVLYDSSLALVSELGLKSQRISDLPLLLKTLKKNNIYTIARVSVFQDPLLASKKPEWAIKSKRGGLWRDRKGLAWVDPSSKDVWDYNISIAIEASSAGFDEINFDYIRFPTDGPLADIIYSNDNKKKRYEVIEDFFKYLSVRMAGQRAYISADLFGLTTERGGEDDMMIGQRLEDAVKYFDYVCPMVYPSHYPPGYMNFNNPADHPYEVVYRAMSSGQKKADGKRAQLRAWIQSFDLGAVYDGQKIKAQIDASDDAGANGWILWNARNYYNNRGLADA